MISPLSLGNKKKYEFPSKNSQLDTFLRRRRLQVLLTRHSGVASAGNSHIFKHSLHRITRQWTYPPAMLKLSILYNTHISILTLSILRNTQLEYKMLSIYNTQLVFCIIWNPYFKIWNPYWLQYDVSIVSQILNILKIT